MIDLIENLASAFLPSQKEQVVPYAHKRTIPLSMEKLIQLLLSTNEGEYK